jgi:hypothetical protein
VGRTAGAIAGPEAQRPPGAHWRRRFQVRSAEGIERDRRQCVRRDRRFRPVRQHPAIGDTVSQPNAKPGRVAHPDGHRVADCRVYCRLADCHDSRARPLQSALLAVDPADGLIPGTALR